jgi:hypothetical protein
MNTSIARAAQAARVPSLPRWAGLPLGAARRSGRMNDAVPILTSAVHPGPADPAHRLLVTDYWSLPSLVALAEPPLPAPLHLCSAISQHRRVLRRCFRSADSLVRAPWVAPLAWSAAPHPKAVLKPRAVQTLRDCRGVLELRAAFGVRACSPPLSSATKRDAQRASHVCTDGNSTSINPLALFIRWQTSILDPRLWLRRQPRYALALNSDWSVDGQPQFYCRCAPRNFWKTKPVISLAAGTFKASVTRK